MFEFSEEVSGSGDDGSRSSSLLEERFAPSSRSGFGLALIICSLWPNFLICDKLIDGKPAAIHKSLQRLEKRGLVVSSVPEGKQIKNWTAVLARGELKEVSTVPINPVLERDLPLDTTPGQSTGVQGLFDGAVEIELSSEEAGHL